MKLRGKVSLKPKLSYTLRSWLPILQADLSSLEETLKEFSKDNPYIEIKSGFEKREKKYTELVYSNKKNSLTDIIESKNTYEKNLEEILQEQIHSSLFPTEKSRTIALKIAENINKEGYFEGDTEKIAKELKTTKEDVEKIRKRFAYLNPPGIGAKDIKESFLFQLEDLDIDGKSYEKVKKIIENLDNLESFKDKKDFQKALSIIKKFKNPPALEFLKDSTEQIVADIFIFIKNKEIEVKLNGEYYPDIIIDIEQEYEQEEFVQKKLKEARNLINALNMRKETLYKLALMIIEYQYDFFFGGEIKPMKLEDIAKELEYNPSTISRAISNKYISCDRGTIPIKNFFARALDDDISNSAVKNYIVEIIKKENKKKPLSDMKIVSMIEEKFGVKIGRRTVAKYRQQLNIAGSSERKKLYELKICC